MPRATNSSNTEQKHRGERARAQQHRRPRLQSNDDDDDDGDDDDDNGDLVRTSVVVVMMPPSSADRHPSTQRRLSSPRFPLSSPPQAHLLTRLWAAELAFTPINLGRATTTSLSPAQSPRQEWGCSWLCSGLMYSVVQKKFPPV